MEFCRDDLIYIAGFFDGEGCLSASRSVNNSYYIRITITNNEKFLLDWISSLFGGKVRPKDRTSDLHEQNWRLVITKSEELRAFLTEILPFSKLKRAQIELGLGMLATLGESGIPTTDATLLLRERVAEELSKLNKKGPR